MEVTVNSEIILKTDPGKFEENVIKKENLTYNLSGKWTKSSGCYFNYLSKCL